MPANGKTPASTTDRTARRATAAFMAASALVAAGTAIGLLSVTGITAHAGGQRGASYSGLILSIVAATSALTMPYGPRMAHRFGTRRAFVLANLLLAVAWTVVGVLILAGAPAMPVLLAAAPVFGVSTSVAVLLAPIINKAYLTGSSMSGTYARMSVVHGVAAVIGSLAGGLLLNAAPLGWGLIINGLLFLPEAAVAGLWPPAQDPAGPAEAGRPWHDIRDIFVGSRQMRLLAMMACGMVIFVAPLSSLVVPITHDLRHEPLFIGAGLLAAALSAGRFFAPALVDRLSRGRTELAAGALAALGAGAMLLLFAVTSMLLTGFSELAVWVVIGLVSGAFRFTQRALSVGAAHDAAAGHHPAKALAALFLVSGLVAPIGLMLWGVLIDVMSAPAAVSVAAIGAMAVFAPMAMRSSARRWSSKAE